MKDLFEILLMSFVLFVLGDRTIYAPTVENPDQEVEAEPVVVEKEVIKEVPKEVIKEVVKEVPVEDTESKRKAEEAQQRADALQREIDRLKKESTVKKDPPKPKQPLRPEAVDWLYDYSSAVSKAKELNRPLHIFFSRSRCSLCEQVKDDVYTDADVMHEVERRTVPLWAYSERGDSLSNSFGIAMWPKVVIVFPDGSNKVFQPSANPVAYRRQLEEALK
jgi:hypothetical protein